MKVGRQKGFTLIEVCLVMLIFGIAVSSLMALFPVSLRQGNQAVSDSVVTAFGDYVLNELAGKASSLQDEDDWRFWKTESQFSKEVIKGLVTSNEGGDSLKLGENTVDDYLGTGVTIKYKLVIAPVDLPTQTKFGKRLFRAILYVTDNKYADVVDTGAVFVTYLFYFGEVP